MSPKSNPRWFQFSLQSLLVTITVICLGLGYVVYRRGQAEGARLAAESLKEKGANFAFTEGNLPGERKDWSVAIFGDDSYERLADLWLEGPAFHDDDFQTVVKLRFLKSLHLEGLDISDAGLRQITALSRLEKLSLGRCRHFTDDGIANLRPMTQLKGLWLHDTAISDEALKHVECFRKLEFLNVDRTRITDIGMASLTKLSVLKGLFACCEGVSDVGVEKLRELKQLEVLRLDDTNISDAGLIHLQQLPHLKELWLTCTSITDQGLIHLEEFKQLEFVMLAGTKATDAGVEKLERALPKLKVGFVRKNDPLP